MRTVRRDGKGGQEHRLPVSPSPLPSYPALAGKRSHGRGVGWAWAEAALHAIRPNLADVTGDICDLDLQRGRVGPKSGAEDGQVRAASQRARLRLNGGDARRHLGVKRIAWWDASHRPSVERPREARKRIRMPAACVRAQVRRGWSRHGRPVATSIMRVPRKPRYASPRCASSMIAVRLTLK